MEWLDRLQPLRVRVRNVVQNTLKKRKTVYEVERDIIDEAVFVTEKWIKRYAQDPRIDWFKGKGMDPFNKMCALIGELSSGLTLGAVGNPYIPAYPLLPREDPRARKDWDIDITCVGTWEVKSTPPIKNYKRFMAPIATWTGKADYTLAVKLKPDFLSKEEAKRIGDIKNSQEAFDIAKGLIPKIGEAWLMGWLTKQEVERLPVKDWGMGDCYWTYLEWEDCDQYDMSEYKLRPMWSFFNMLEKARAKIAEVGKVEIK